MTYHFSMFASGGDTAIYVEEMVEVDLFGVLGG